MNELIRVEMHQEGKLTLSIELNLLKFMNIKKPN